MDGPVPNSGHAWDLVCLGAEWGMGGKPAQLTMFP